jgi:hypothetical protein
MKTIAEIVYETTTALELIPSENIGISTVNSSDWDGLPRILIIEGDSAVEDETQFGPLSQRTTLTVFALHPERSGAVDLCRQAADAALTALEKLERVSGSGILCVTKTTNGIRNIPDRTEFEASRSFRVLNNINL